MATQTQTPRNTPKAPTPPTAAAKGKAPAAPPAEEPNYGDAGAYVDMHLNEDGLQPWDGRSRGIDAGSDYPLEVKECVREISKAGNPMLTVTYEVLSGPCQGRTQKAWYTISEKKGSRTRMLALTRATGIPLDANGGFAADAIVGCQIIADVQPDPAEVELPDGSTVVKEYTRIVNERPIQ